jgi:hypothetical protein
MDRNHRTVRLIIGGRPPRRNFHLYLKWRHALHTSASRRPYLNRCSTYNSRRTATRHPQAINHHMHLTMGILCLAHRCPTTFPGLDRTMRLHLVQSCLRFQGCSCRNPRHRSMLAHQICEALQCSLNSDMRHSTEGRLVPHLVMTGRHMGVNLNYLCHTIRKATTHSIRNNPTRTGARRTASLQTRSCLLINLNHLRG